MVEAIRSGRFDVDRAELRQHRHGRPYRRIDAAIKAVETVDACLGRLLEAVEAAGGTLVITADHGNAEMMRDPETGEPHTAHTLNPVPFIVANPPDAAAARRSRAAGRCRADSARHSRARKAGRR